MKIRTKPSEFEAIEFNGITPEVLSFIEGCHSQIHQERDYFILSSIIGNKRLEVGDILYKSEFNFETKMTMISVLSRGASFDKHFEIVG